MLALQKEMLFVFPCWVNFFFLLVFIKRISRILNNEIKRSALILPHNEKEIIWYQAQFLT